MRYVCVLSCLVCFAFTSCVEIDREKTDVCNLICYLPLPRCFTAVEGGRYNNLRKGRGEGGEKAEVENLILTPPPPPPPQKKKKSCQSDGTIQSSSVGRHPITTSICSFRFLPFKRDQQVNPPSPSPKTKTLNKTKQTKTEPKQNNKPRVTKSWKSRSPSGLFLSL